MSRAYIRLDPGFFERKIVEQRYSPSEGMALVGAFCLGEQQIPRGHFRDQRVLRALLGPLGRYVPSLVERGDLIEDEVGRLYVDGWDEWQEGDVTVRERMARVRRRVRIGSDAGHRKDAHAGDRKPDRHSTVPLRTAVVNSETGEAESNGGAGLIPPPPAQRGRRNDGTNPRASGSSPRQQRANPRVTGSSVRQQRQAEKRGPTQLGRVLAEAQRRQAQPSSDDDAGSFAEARR